MSACALALGAGTAGCDQDEFLETPQYTILPEENLIMDEAHAVSSLNGCYDIFFPEGTDADGWNFKPQLFLGCHPTLDTQATGWDAAFGKQQMPTSQSDVAKAWKYLYRGIGRCNVLIDSLENAAPDKKAWDSYRYMLNEAHVIRGYLYLYLTENWGNVPLYLPGEDFINTPDKAAATDDELLDQIIADLSCGAGDNTKQDDASGLDWQPWNGEYGRVTRGMAMTYRAEAYLWKAYRKAGDNAKNEAYDKALITKAKDDLQCVVNSGTYELAKSFATLWDGDVAWPKESIWQVAMDMGPGNRNSWSNDSHIFVAFFSAATCCGGWGSEYLSWELFFLYEKGDKRRDASMCIAPVKQMSAEIANPDYKSDEETPGVAKTIANPDYEAKYADYKPQYTYGRNPYTQEDINGWNQFRQTNNADRAPNAWTLKLWRLLRAQWDQQHSPAHFYYKRYAGVLLDLAECLFRLNGPDDEQAWAYIDQVRDRAFGNQEIGLDQTSNISYYNACYGELSWAKGGWTDFTTYPVPFNTQTVTVTPAKDYYGKFMTCSNGDLTDEAHEPFTGKLDTWEVALLQERRKEFSSEWNLRTDLQRANSMVAHIECDYPKGKSTLDDLDNWHYTRDWDFNPAKMFAPIPQDELLRNKLLKQNSGY